MNKIILKFFVLFFLLPSSIKGQKVDTITFYVNGVLRSSEYYYLKENQNFENQAIAFFEFNKGFGTYKKTHEKFVFNFPIYPKKKDRVLNLKKLLPTTDSLKLYFCFENGQPPKFEPIILQGKEEVLVDPNGNLTLLNKKQKIEVLGYIIKKIEQEIKINETTFTYVIYIENPQFKYNASLTKPQKRIYVLNEDGQYCKKDNKRVRKMCYEIKK